MSNGLVPSARASGRIRVDRELPLEARNWRRILDLTRLEPGDLLLFRDVGREPDWVAQQIVQAQLNGGFPRRHAQWTHAAVYLGDDEHLCESTFGIAGYPTGVIVRSAHAYCDGKHAIRARRPRNLTAKQRVRVAIGALTNLGQGYSWGQVWHFYWAAASGRGFWQTRPRGPRIRMRALVCSALYQDAYNFALQGDTTITGGALATPAHLSASADFEPRDPPLRWLAIA